jgi:hypothetical protein
MICVEERGGNTASLQQKKKKKKKIDCTAPRTTCTSDARSVHRAFQEDVIHGTKYVMSISFIIVTLREVYRTIVYNKSSVISMINQPHFGFAFHTFQLW